MQEKAPYLDQYGFLEFGPTKALNPQRDAVFYRNGEKWILKAGSDPKARAIVRAINNLDQPTLGPILRVMSKVNRFMAATSTSHSPEFFFMNPIRDLLEAHPRLEIIWSYNAAFRNSTTALWSTTFFNSSGENPTFWPN